MSVSSLQILIVDDFAEDRDRLRRALSKGMEQPITFFEAENGEEALRLCNQSNSDAAKASAAIRQPFDLVLLDLRLPDMDGKEVLQKLKGDNAILPMPVVVLTEEPRTAEASAALALGAQDFIAKARITPDYLAHVVRNAGERYQILQKLQASEIDSRTLLRQREDSPIYAPQGALIGIVGASSDISERGQTAEALHAYAQRFQSLANAIPQIVWINNGEGVREYLNDRWMEYTGLTLAVSLIDANQVIHPDDVDSAVAAWEAARQKGEPYEYEMRLRRKDGVYRWHLMRTVPVHNTAGKLVNWYGTATDIDTRKRAELNQQFLADLATQLRTIASPEEIRRALVSALGARLDVAHCGLYAVDVATDCVMIEGNWRQQDAHELSGVYPLSAFMLPEFRRQAEAGQTIVVTDSETDARTAPNYETGYKQLKVRSFVFTPYIEQERWVALLAIDCPAVRVWHDDEVALLETVASRFWPLIEKARAEQALRTNEAQLRLITDAIPGLISYVDADQRYRFVNAAYESWFGRPREQIIGCHMREVIGEEAYARVQTYVQAALAGTRVTFQNIYPRSDGAMRVAMVTYAPQMKLAEAPVGASANNRQVTPTGEVVGFNILLTDITGLKEIEAALRVSEEQSRRQLAELQAIYNTAPIGLFVLDTDLHYVRVNDRLAEINGLAAAAHIGRSGREIVPNLAKSTEPLFRQVIETGKPILNLETTGATPAQPAVQHTWLGSYYPLRTADGQVIGMNGVVQDITDRKHYEQELQKINETLELRVKERTTELMQRNQELDQFAYIASHDLKAPLRAIEHLASWINDDANHLLPNKSKEYLGKLQGRVKRMETLLDDLLAYSRADRREGVPENVDTQVLIDEVIKLLALPQAFTLTIQPQMPVFITERVPLELVLRNLIGNAIKHHHRADGHVQIMGQDQGNLVEFVIIDDGPGIDPQFHERIFQMFQTLKPRDQVEGSGIGLAVVKKVIESRGGQIYVESAEGEGATFRFTWSKG